MNTNAGKISGAETILVVEDEELLREMESSILLSHGYRVLQAETGRQAFDLWKAEGERIGLLLTDIVLPRGITGVELAKRLREGQPELKIIFTTGRVLHEADHKFLAQLNARFLQKPFEHGDLIQVVRAAFGGTEMGNFTQSVG
jgi:CheY-like chemotaxis protein